MSPVRLVLFDALYTLLHPRKPIPEVYAHVFSRHLGRSRISAAAVEKSFPNGVFSQFQEQGLKLALVDSGQTNSATRAEGDEARLRRR